nr:hypothetical protein [Plasmodium ashfordi]
MIIIYKCKFLIKNFKNNLNTILNLKLKFFNININLLNKKIIDYINMYKLNIFIIYIYSNKTFKLIYNYTILNLYKKNNNINILNLIYYILLYKKFQLNFYNIYQLINIIYNNIKILKKNKLNK